MVSSVCTSKTDFFGLAGLGEREQEKSRQQYFVSKYVHEGRLTTCADAGMTLQDAVGIRAWMFSRYNLVAAESEAASSITAAGAISDPFSRVLGGDKYDVVMGSGTGSKRAVLLELIGYSLTLGACLAAVVELGVMGYHMNAGRLRVQRDWMLFSLLAQVVVVVLFFLAVPAVALWWHRNSVESAGWRNMALLVGFLCVVEANMIRTKVSIMRYLGKKLKGEEKEKAEKKD
eukprot:g16039.t1